jgi:hypothetical protein
MHDTFGPHAIRRLGIWIGTLTVGLAIVAVNPINCHAQQASSSFGTPASKQINNQPVSPYLNLAQPGLNPAITYGTLIQPELQLRNTIANQQNLLGSLSQQVQSQPAASLQTPVLLETGHQTYFLDTGTYFFSISRTPRQGK